MPISPASAALTSRMARSACARIACASGRKLRPGAVSSTRWRSRSNSVTPSSRSSFCNCMLSAGWTMHRRSAAWPKCSSSESTTKARSSLSSMRRIG